MTKSQQNAVDSERIVISPSPTSARRYGPGRAHISTITSPDGRRLPSVNTAPGGKLGAVIRSRVMSAGRENSQSMNTKHTNTTRGFLDLALALYIAAVSLTPLAIALALDIADNLPGTDYPASIYAD